MTGIALPSNPYLLSFEGAQVNNGSLLQYLGALSANGAPSLGNQDLYADTTATAITYSAVGVLKGIIRRSGGAGISDIMPSASSLFSAWPGAQVGNTCPVLLCNLNSGTITLQQSADASVTLAGTTTVVTVAARLYILKITAAPVAIVGLSYSAGVVTLTTALPHGLVAAGNAIVAGLANSAFNNTFTISTVPNSYQLTYPLATTTAFATNPTVPSPSVGQPGLLNTAPTMTMTGCFAWPATMIA
jgi:hypothetical protein